MLPMGPFWSTPGLVHARSGPSARPCPNSDQGSEESLVVPVFSVPWGFPGWQAFGTGSHWGPQPWFMNTDSHVIPGFWLFRFFLSLVQCTPAPGGSSSNWAPLLWPPAAHRGRITSLGPCPHCSVLCACAPLPPSWRPWGQEVNGPLFQSPSTGLGTLRRTKVLNGMCQIGNECETVGKR